MSNHILNNLKTKLGKRKQRLEKLEINAAEVKSDIEKLELEIQSISDNSRN